MCSKKKFTDDWEKNCFPCLFACFPWHIPGEKESQDGVHYLSPGKQEPSGIHQQCSFQTDNETIKMETLIMCTEHGWGGEDKRCKLYWGHVWSPSHSSRKRNLFSSQGNSFIVQEIKRQHLLFYTKKSLAQTLLQRLKQEGDIWLGKEQADLKRHKLSVAMALYENTLLAVHSALYQKFIDTGKSFW